MKPPTLRRPRRLRIDIVPTVRMFSTERMVWWIDLLQLAVMMAVPLIVFHYAGGTADQITAWLNTTHDAPTGAAALRLLAAPPAPLGLAALSVLAMAVVGNLAEIEGRRSERRHFHRWYAAQHPEDVPGDAVALLVQAILREHGPMTSHDIRARLAEGGSWGPAVQVSPYGLLHGVLQPKGKPAPWLADRKPLWPWSLRENPYVPPAAGADQTPAAVLERLVLMHGPLRLPEVTRLLHSGGEHGRPVLISSQTVAKRLARADWLKPRERGDMYEHVGGRREEGS